MAKDEKKPLIPWWGWLLIVLAVGVVGGTGLQKNASTQKK